MRPAVLLAGIALLAGCGAEPVPTENFTATTADESQAGLDGTLTAADRQDLAALRAATAPFHRIAVADAAGYDNQFPAGCMTSPAGGMGFHYLKGTSVGSLDPATPQLVIYEPERNGTLRLVGVEFIYPGQSTDTPPVLFGQSFRWNETFQVWALHVWAWKNNPTGLFQDWNPDVSCQYAASLSTMAH
jgi:hypothetical protein